MLSGFRKGYHPKRLNVLLKLFAPYRNLFLFKLNATFKAFNVGKLLIKRAVLFFTLNNLRPNRLKFTFLFFLSPLFLSQFHLHLFLFLSRFAKLFCYPVYLFCVRFLYPSLTNFAKKYFELFNNESKRCFFSRGLIYKIPQFFFNIILGYRSEAKEVDRKTKEL